MRRFGTSIVITAALAAVIFMVRPAEDATTASVPSAAIATGAAKGTYSADAIDHALPDEARLGMEGRREARIEAMQSLLNAAQQQPGNLAATLQKLHQLCLPEEDCAALIRAALAQHADTDFAALVEQAMTRLPLYESAMQEVVMSTSIPPRERYAALHELRVQTLGREVTEALFGQEAAWADYQFRYGDLMDGATALSATDRVAALNQLRHNAFGEYTAALDAVEGPDGRYQRELGLLLAGVDDPDTRDRITRELRQRHYPADVIARMEQRDRQQQTLNQQVQAYQHATDALEQDMAALRDTLSPQVWQQQYEQALMQLRLQYFP